jgi:alpha/beta superfamily hydrolase
MVSPTRPTLETSVRFPSAGGPSVALEGLLGTFGHGAKHPAAVLCHPGGQGQTGMEYPVIAACSAALQQAGFVTLRFNFRGVQGSGGSCSGGLHETRDVHGAVRFLMERNDVDPSHVYLVGDSFGAWMILEAAREDERVAGMVCIVLPLALLPSPPEHLRHDRRPKFFIAAEHDQFCDLDAFKALYRQWATPKDLIVLAGSDHFLGIGPSADPVNRAAQIAEAVVSWLCRTSETTR